MSRFLLVPVRTDALCLTKDRADSYDFIQPHDYTSHPVYDRIIYAGGWEPTSLEAGVHLHWSLPDPLTTSAPLVPRGVLRNLGLRKRLDGEQARALRHEDFPAVPNRWLVERLDASGHLPSAQWMIHSDRLSQDGRTLGHAERLPATPAPRSPAISKLTVQGFGNPWFAALYQNCRNVFGFHDAESGARASFTYRIYGWYDDPAQDALWAFLKAVRGVAQAPLEDKDWHSAILTRFGWKVPAGELPQRILCYSQITVHPENFDPESEPHQSAPTLTVAGSGLEALSRNVAGRVAADATETDRLENMLEALHLSETLGQRQLDLQFRLKEGRHEREFRPIEGGNIWAIAIDKGEADRQAEDPTLPDDLAHAVNDLNLSQQAYDRAWDEIASLRRELICDCAYLLRLNRQARDTREFLADDRRLAETGNWLSEFAQQQADQEREKATALAGAAAIARDTVVNGSLARLEAAVARTGDLQLSRDGRHLWVGLDASDRPDTLAAAVARNLESLQGRLQCLAHSSGRLLLDWLDAVNSTDGASRSAFVHRHGASSGLRAEDLQSLREKSGGLVFLRLKSIDDNHAAAYLKANEPAATLRVEVTVEHGPPLTLKSIRTADAAPDAKRDIGSRLGRRALDIEQQAPSPGADRYVLQIRPGPRYWAPTNPVVLLSGKGLDPTPRHGADGPECLALDAPPAGASLIEVPWRSLDNAESAVGISGDMIARAYHADSPGVRNATSEFHPIFVEWKASVTPEITSDQYAHNAGVGRFELKADEVELRRISAAPLSAPPGLIFGRSALTVHAPKALERKLLAFISERCRAAAKDPANSAGRPSLLAIADLNPEAAQPDAQHWANAKACFPSADPVVSCMKAFEVILADRLGGVHHQAVSLSGFNDSMVAIRRGFQWPIDCFDPPDQTLTKRIRAAAGPDYFITPLLTTTAGHDEWQRWRPSYNPIRTGTVKLDSLTVVDSFGRFVNLEGAAPHQLSPRLSQPARVNARWLSAKSSEQEMNTHPASSPICGWVVPNHLDASLAIYAPDGAMQGYIDKRGRWHSAPAGGSPITPGDIANPHLSKLVLHLCGTGSDVEKLLDTLDAALEQIDPEGYRQHQAQVLLMGRPLALVRLSVDLHLKGRPAIDYRRDKADAKLAVPVFPQVEFPIRIGEHRHINDGVAAYWIEKEGRLPERYYAPQQEGGATFVQSLEQAPHVLSILFDPRALLHVTTGILPTKVLSIPPDQYTGALGRIAVTFLTAPVLTPAGKVDLALPDEPGFSWSWLQVEHGAWTRVHTHPTIRRDDFVREFPRNGIAYWSALEQAGWLEHCDLDAPGSLTARVVPPEQRKQPRLAGIDQDAATRIERVLAAKAKVLEPPNRQARWQEVHELREGWLRLSPQPGQPKQP